MSRTSLAVAGNPPISPPLGRCPGCRSTRMQTVLELNGVPAHTAALLDSKEEALAYPRRDITLAVCATCGLLTNIDFDAQAHDYSVSYEEVQTHSTRFVTYVDELARSLVERHELKGKSVLEIGCGTADLLVRLCTLTGAKGIGVDPSFREESLVGPGAHLVQVEQAFFTAEHVPDGVGAVICRHTLEHVHDVHAFLSALRSGLDRAPDAVVVFEVPDTRRVLREIAFWDVFYEHCSYFTPGSLARAFRSAGLMPLDVHLTFEQQYVLITAISCERVTGSPLPLEESPADVVSDAEEFAHAFADAEERWRGLLRDVREGGGRTAIWGAGSKGVAFLTTLGAGDDVVCAVDVNPAKQGLYTPGTGHEIVPPDALVELRPSLVVVMNPAYATEIREQLDGLGVEAEVRAL